MVHLTTTEAREQLAEILNRVAYGGERVVLSRHGKELAVLVSVEDLARLEAMEDEADIAAADEALAEPGATPYRVPSARRGPGL